MSVMNVIDSISGLKMDSLTRLDITSLMKSIDSLRESLMKVKPVETPVHPVQKLVNTYTSKSENFLSPEILKELKSTVKTLSYSPNGTNAPETVLFGDCKYVYNNHSKKVIPSPLNSHPVISEVLNLVNLNLGGASFNSVLINRYRNKNVKLGFHKDDESSMVPGSRVLTLSVGATRRMLLCQKRNDQLEDMVSVTLNENDLLIMESGCQDQLFHSILPGNDFERGYRWSLTFRELISATAVPKPKERILVVGSSLVKSLDHNLLSNRSKGDKFCEVKCLPGAHVPQVKNTITKIKDKENVSDLVIVVGGNDAQNCEKEGTAQVLSDFKDLAEVIRADYSKARVYIFNVIPRKVADVTHLDRVAEINSFLSDFCNLNGFRFIERYSHFHLKGSDELNPVMYNKDMIHLSPMLGVKVLAKVIIGAIFLPRYYPKKELPP